MLHRIEWWGEKNEQMFSGENVFRLIYDSVCRAAATEGACSGV